MVLRAVQSGLRFLHAACVDICLCAIRTHTIRCALPEFRSQSLCIALLGSWRSGCMNSRSSAIYWAGSGKNAQVEAIIPPVVGLQFQAQMVNPYSCWRWGQLFFGISEMKENCQGFHSDSLLKSLQVAVQCLSSHHTGFAAWSAMSRHKSATKKT